MKHVVERHEHIVESMDREIRLRDAEIEHLKNSSSTLSRQPSVRASVLIDRALIIYEKNYNLLLLGKSMLAMKVHGLRKRCQELQQQQQQQLNPTASSHTPLQLKFCNKHTPVRGGPAFVARRAPKGGSKTANLILVRLNFMFSSFFNHTLFLLSRHIKF